MPYRHILVATDGSARSRKAIRAAVELAQKFGARMTALYVTREGVPTAFSGDTLYFQPGLSPRTRQALRSQAERALAVAELAAKASGVRYASARSIAVRPWSAIVQTARAKNCDLIVMATHGRRGLASLASQTAKAIAHTRIPILVCR